MAAPPAQPASAGQCTAHCLPALHWRVAAPRSLGRASGQYAARTVWCEVFLVDDGAPALSPAHYHGIYIGLEKLKVAPQRVAVAPLEPPNLSGGYLFSYDNDNLEEGDVTFGPLQGWQHPFQMK